MSKANAAIAAAIPGAEHRILDGQTHNVTPEALRPEIVQVLRMSTVGELQAAVSDIIGSELPDATTKLYHGIPVWCVGDEPTIGLKPAKAHLSVLFFRGQALLDGAARMRRASWSRRARSRWPRSSSRAPADLDEARYAPGCARRSRGSESSEADAHLHHRAAPERQQRRHRDPGCGGRRTGRQARAGRGHPRTAATATATPPPSWAASISSG